MITLKNFYNALVLLSYITTGFMTLLYGGLAIIIFSFISISRFPITPPDFLLYFFFIFFYPVFLSSIISPFILYRLKTPLSKPKNYRATQIKFIASIILGLILLSVSFLFPS